ncbi:MAG: lysine--tRNA ligase, partial [Clostridiales bacterium]|nr:lysine--tRNA ligase [Clostridiales bacterium]
MTDDMISSPEQELSELLQIRLDKLKRLQEEGRDPFQITKFKRTAFSSDALNNFETMENKDVSMAGRIMAKREMGKAIFADLIDDKGRIQL